MKARLLVLALFSALALSGCEEIFNALLDNGAPTGVSASDGEFANEIHVSWGAPNMSGSKWKDDEILGYEISWDGPTAAPSWSSGTSCMIHVEDANRATPYTVTVTTSFKEYGLGGSDSDEGFALDAEDLLWVDGGADYAIAGDDRWYLTMLQEGFSYSFAFAGGSGTVAFYPYKSLDDIITFDPGAAVGSTQSWTCDSEGKGHKFFIRVDPDTATSFTATYSLP